MSGRFIASIALWSRIAAALSVLVGCVVLSGFATGSAHLVTFNLPTGMKANTAAALVAAGTSLLLARFPRRSRRGAAKVLAGLVVLVGLVSIVENLTGVDLSIDQLLFRAPPSLQAMGAPGRMGPNTALALVVLGCALFLLDFENHRRHRPAQMLALLANLIAGLAALGYLYWVPELYTVPQSQGMPLQTALTLLMLSSGILCAAPEYGLAALVTTTGTSGIVARRLLPAAVVLPVILGCLRLYSARSGMVEVQVGVSAIIASFVVGSVGLILLTMRSLYRADSLREKAEMARRRSEAIATGLFEHGPDAVVAVDADGRIAHANALAATLFGYRRDELLGQPVEMVIPARFADQHRSHCSAYRAHPSVRTMGVGLDLFARRKDGSEFPVDVSLSPLRGEDRTLVVASVRDASERAAASRAVATRAREQRAAAELGQLALAGAEIPRLMDAIALRAAEVLEGDYSEILELQPDGSTFLLRAGFGWDAGIVGRATMSPEAAPQAAYSLTESAVVVCEDASRETRFVPSSQSAVLGLGSGITVRIASPDQPYGVLGVHSRTRRAYSADDAHFMQMCATLLAQAIQRRRAEEAQAALLEIAKDCGIGLDREALLERVQRRIAALLPCDRVVTYGWDAERNVFRAIAWHGIPPDLVDDTAAGEFYPEQKIVHHLVSSETVVINDIDHQDWLPVELLSHFRLTSLLLVPLVVHGRTIGALDAVNAESGRRFDAHQVALFEGIARQVGIAMEGAELRQAQQQEAALNGALARVGRELISLLDTPLLLERLCELAVELLGCDSSQTLLAADDEEAFVLAATSGLFEDFPTMRALRIPASIIANALIALEVEEVTQVNPLDRSPRLAAAAGARTSLVSALRRGGRLVGLQTASWVERTTPSTPEERRLLGGITRMASLALQNAQLMEELARANRVKSEFVAAMSHELRTPLNIAMGYSDLLLEDAFGALPPEQRSVLEGVQRNQRQLLEMLSGILDLDRLQAGRLPVELSDFTLAELLDELAREVEKKPGVDLQWTARHGLPPLRSDRAKVKLVLRNLVQNALKYTDQGSVTVGAHDIEGGLEVCVIDTGIGIADELRELIFEPFRQGGQHARGGVGLGLHIARSMLQLLGGTIGVESDVGRGSTFRVRLPVDRPHAAA